MSKSGPENAFIKDAAEMMAGGIDLDTLAALYRIAPTDALAQIESNSDEIDQAAAAIVLSGGDVALTAKKTLAATLRQLAIQVDSGELTATVLVQVAAMLHKVSGLSDKPIEKPATSGFSITIRLPGDDIHIGGKPASRAIDGVFREVGYD